MYLHFFLVLLKPSACTWLQQGTCRPASGPLEVRTAEPGQHETCLHLLSISCSQMKLLCVCNWMVTYGFVCRQDAAGRQHHLWIWCRRDFFFLQGTNLVTKPNLQQVAWIQVAVHKCLGFYALRLPPQLPWHTPCCPALIPWLLPHAWDAAPHLLTPFYSQRLLLVVLFTCVFVRQLLNGLLDSSSLLFLAR